MDDWKEFSLTFRLGYNNITSGINQYQFSFWSWEQLRGIGYFSLKSNYTEKEFWNARLYIDELEELTGNINVYPWEFSYLAKYGETFTILDQPFTYNVEENILYSAKGTETREIKSRLLTGEFSINGEIMGKDIPFQFNDTGGGNSLKFFHLPHQNKLKITRGDKDGCGYIYGGQIYDLKTKEKYLDIQIFKHHAEGTDGTILMYHNKKLEIFPLVQTGVEFNNYSLKYRYSIKNDDQREERIENFIVKDAKTPVNLDAPCWTESFSYSFDMEREEVVVKRNKEVWWKSETYTWKIGMIPNFYRTRP